MLNVFVCIYFACVFIDIDVAWQKMLSYIVPPLLHLNIHLKVWFFDNPSENEYTKMYLK